MKKLSTLLLTSALVLGAGEAIAKPFSGFYLGAEAGYVQRPVQTKIDTKIALANNTTVSGNPSNTNQQKGFLYGLMAGYGQNLGGFYLGLEANLKDDNGSENHDYTVQLNESNSSAKHSFKLISNYDRGFVLGLAPRVGAVVCDSHLLYAKLGIESSRDHAFIKHGNSQTKFFEAKKWKTVFVPGLGYEKAFGNILLRAEYGYNFGAKFSGDAKEANRTFNEKTSYKVRYTSHEFKIGLSYQF